MLSTHQERILKFMGLFYRHFYQVPVHWSPKRKRISTNPEKRKWIYYCVGLTFVFSLWLSCVYTLGTQPFLKRKALTHFPMSVLTTGFCTFTICLSGGRGIFALRKNLYISAINQFVELEEQVYRRYNRHFLNANQRPNLMETFFYILQILNTLPYLVVLVCLYWDLDGPYWVLEDFGQEPMYRETPTILVYLAIRFFLLLPGFLETVRALDFIGYGLLSCILYIKEMVVVLTYRVHNSHEFFQYYTKLAIICNVFSDGFKNACWLAVTISYFLVIQTLWICVCGWAHLETPIFMLFVSCAFIIGGSAAISLPLLAETGERIILLPESKKNEMKIRYRLGLGNDRGKRFDILKAKSLRPIPFTYGSFCPLGKAFCINIFHNGFQDLCTVLILFDFHGSRI